MDFAAPFVSGFDCLDYSLLPDPAVLNGPTPATPTPSPACQSLSLGPVPRWAQSPGRKHNLTSDGRGGGGKWKFTIPVHRGTSDAPLRLLWGSNSLPHDDCPWNSYSCMTGLAMTQNSLYFPHRTKPEETSARPYNLTQLHIDLSQSSCPGNLSLSCNQLFFS